MTERLSIDRLLQAARLRYLSRKNHLEQGRQGMFKRPEAWFDEQERALEADAQIGELLAFLAANSEAFEAWRNQIREKVA